MRNAYSTQAPKKAANLSLNSELLAEAKRLNINLSATMEKALEKEVNQRRKTEWLEQNAVAINAHNFHYTKITIKALLPLTHTLLMFKVKCLIH